MLTIFIELENSPVVVCPRMTESHVTHVTFLFIFTVSPLRTEIITVLTPHENLKWTSTHIKKYSGGAHVYEFLEDADNNSSHVCFLFARDMTS